LIAAVGAKIFLAEVPLFIGLQVYLQPWLFHCGTSLYIAFRGGTLRIMNSSRKTQSFGRAAAILIGALILATFHTASAVGPALSETARKETKSDPEVVKENVDRMKEDVLNKKTQMLLFRQLLKSEAFESSFPVVTVVHLNEMSSRYKIFSLTYTIDEDRVYTYYMDEPGANKALGREISVFKGPLVPGSHELVVDVVYRGNDSGVFSYINEYKIPAQIKTTFKVDKGQNATVQVVGYEKGWALTDFKDRPDLRVKFYSSNQAKELR
jgi:hypothetical protein